jgi:hypothetical protein
VLPHVIKVEDIERDLQNPWMMYAAASTSDKKYRKQLLLARFEKKVRVVTNELPGPEELYVRYEGDDLLKAVQMYNGLL